MKKQGDTIIALCPSHDDRKQSLSIKQGENGGIVLFCHAGCETKAVLAAIGCTFADITPESQSKNGHKLNIVAEYDYRDEAGKLLYQAVRLEPKDFRQRRPDGAGRWIWKLKGVKPVLYRLPELIAAETGGLVFIPEGEADVDAVRALGLTATCNVGGAGKWRDEYSKHFRGRQVFILPDNDPAPSAADKKGFVGQKHAVKVYESLRGVAELVRIVALPNLPPRGDVSDWLKAGGTKDELLRLCDEAAKIPETEFVARVSRYARFAADKSFDGDPAVALGETAPVSVKSADEIEPEADTLAQLLISLTSKKSRLFHDAAANCYATVAVGDHEETYKLGGRDFKDWLAGELYKATGRGATGDKINEAVTVLRAQARYDSPEVETHIRIAEHDGVIYLDLADRRWRQVKITADRWELIESRDSPVRFRRAGGTLALPEPVGGGELGELRGLLNLPSDEIENRDDKKGSQNADAWALILSWLIAAFKPCNESRFAYPLLAVHGEQGSAKSTTCRLLRRLIDPNKADLRSAPRDERDLAIAAEHSRIIAFDNLTHVTESLSNAASLKSTLQNENNRFTLCRNLPSQLVN